MECSEFKMNIKEFVAGTLPNDMLESCLAHCDNCKECKDELEIYFIVEYGINDESRKRGPFILGEVIGKWRKELEDRIKRNKRRRQVKDFIFKLSLLLVIIIVFTVIFALF